MSRKVCKPSTNISPSFPAVVAALVGRSGQGHVDVSSSRGRGKIRWMYPHQKLTTGSYCMSCKTRQKAEYWIRSEVHQTLRPQAVRSQTGSCVPEHLHTIAAHRGLTGHWE